MNHSVFATMLTAVLALSGCGPAYAQVPPRGACVPAADVTAKLAPVTRHVVDLAAPQRERVVAWYNAQEPVSALKPATVRVLTNTSGESIIVLLIDAEGCILGSTRGPAAALLEILDDGIGA